LFGVEVGAGKISGWAAFRLFSRGIPRAAKQFTIQQEIDRVNLDVDDGVVVNMKYNILVKECGLEIRRPQELFSTLQNN